MLIRVITAIRSAAPKSEHLNRAPGKEVHGGDKACYCYLRLGKNCSCGRALKFSAIALIAKTRYASRIIILSVFFFRTYYFFSAPDVSKLRKQTLNYVGIKYIQKVRSYKTG